MNQFVLAENKRKKHSLRTFKLSNSGGWYTCSLCYKENNETSFFSNAATYPADTVAYAVYRYLKHHAHPKDEYVWVAVKLGLQSGKRNTLQRTLIVPAKDLELPGGQAAIHFSISCGTITITKVSISA